MTEIIKSSANARSPLRFSQRPHHASTPEAGKLDAVIAVYPPKFGTRAAGCS